MLNHPTPTNPAARTASLPLLAGLALSLSALGAHAQTPTTAPASATAGTTSVRPAQIAPGLAPASPAQGATGFVPAGSNPVVPSRVGRGALRPALIDLEFLAQQPRLLTPRNLRPLPGAGSGLAGMVEQSEQPKVIALPDKPRERPVGLTFKPEPVATPTPESAAESALPADVRVVRLPFPTGLEPDAPSSAAAMPETAAAPAPTEPVTQVTIGQIVPLPTPLPVVEAPAPEPAPAPVVVRAEPETVRELPSGLAPAREVVTPEVTTIEPVITRAQEPAVVATPVMPIAPVLPFPPEASANLPASTAGFSLPVAAPAPVAQAEPLPMPVPANEPVLVVAAPVSEPTPSPAPEPLIAPASAPELAPMPATSVSEVPATLPEPVVVATAPAPTPAEVPVPTVVPAPMPELAAAEAPQQPAALAPVVASEVAPVVVQREGDGKFNSIELMTPQTTPAASTAIAPPAVPVEAVRAPAVVAAPATDVPSMPAAPVEAAITAPAPAPALAADPALAGVPQLEVRPAPEPASPALSGAPVSLRTPELPVVIAPAPAPEPAREPMPTPAPALTSATVTAPVTTTDAPADTLSEPLNSAIERAAAQLLSSQAAAKTPAPTPAPATSALPELLPTPEAPAQVLNKPAPATGNDVRPAPASGSALDPFSARSEGVRVRVAELSGTQGMVQWLKDGSPDWNIPELSEQDSGKFTVRTGPDAGALLTLDDAHRVRLGRLSRADLRSMTLPEAGSTRRVVVALTRGRVAVTPAPGSAVNVYTPTSMIVVREPTEVIHDTAGGTRTVSYVEKAPAAAEVPVP
jgi:hypothetical protein